MKFKKLANLVSPGRADAANTAFSPDRRKFLRTGCACGALSLSSAGMALLATTGSARAGVADELVKAGHLPAGCISHLLLAAQRGLFKEAGLAVDITQFNGPMENLRALGVGGVDVAHNPWTASMADYAEGNDGLRIIGGSGISGIELVAREGSVTSVEEFVEAAGQGLRVGTLRLDTLELVAYGTMSQNGLSYSDYEMTFFNGMPGMGEALINGNVDVCTLAQPYAETVVKESGGKYIATSNDVWGPDAADCVINATADFMEERPEVATRYMEVLKEAGEQFHSDFESALDDLEPLFSASREVLEVALKRQPPAPVMSQESADGIRQGVDYLIELGYFDSNIADEVIDLRLSPSETA
ncbi:MULTISPECIES: ABC transporter substrate-binding protein [unclassified Thioalkalivibrio]|uniref:ABC transporter substrate-binding protein n=1 Tax=unclassified Thioalkalivibrio TaxID=2621013 RepID=UPI00056E9C3F|nr:MULTISPECIES: ABC transporter substrate-binding protein [unclassified Thioalkalivibrio]PYG01423.1 NitT/TauT family transport system substrate-binding protein [Thioalkalivibrio sp. ALE21]